MPVQERTIFAAFYRLTDHMCWLIAEPDDRKNLVEGFLIGNEYGGWGKAELQAMKEKKFRVGAGDSDPTLPVHISPRKTMSSTFH
jgi:hypothetical protein